MKESGVEEEYALRYQGDPARPYVMLIDGHRRRARRRLLNTYQIAPIPPHV